MQIYNISLNSDFFWNDGVNFPTKEYFNNISWTRNLLTQNVNMLNSYENVEILTDKPVSYFRIMWENKTLFYMTKNFKIANGVYVNNCEIDYWASYILNDEKFWNTKFNFIRQPSLLNLRYWDFTDPLLTKYKTTKKKIATHYFYGENKQWNKNEKYNSLFYAVFLMDFRAYRHKDDIGRETSNLFYVLEQRAQGTSTQVKFRQKSTVSDFYIFVPITGFERPNIEFYFNGGNPNTTASSVEIDCLNHFEGVAQLISQPFFESRFKGIFCGPPLSSFPATNTVLKSIEPTEQEFTYTSPFPDRRFGNNNYLAYIMTIGGSIDLSSISFATPNMNQYFYQILDFEINNIAIDSFLSKDFTNNVHTINGAKLTFTNKFVAYLSQDKIDKALNFPHQMVSVKSGYAEFINSNTNTLDTGLKSQLASGIIGGVAGLATTVGSIATGNAIGGVLGGMSTISNITSTISGISSKIASARDARNSAKNDVVGVVDEGPKLSVLNNWINEISPSDNKYTFISKWNDFTNDELSTLNNLVIENGYYGLIRDNFKNRMQNNQDCYFFQTTEEEQMKNYIVNDSFFNNISFKLWMKNTLANGVRLWKRR